MSDTTDILIAGAGVAGTSLAISLAGKGFRVRVIEKRREASKRIAGELLQPGGREQLHRLNLQHCIEGIDAVDVSGYALFRDKEHIRIDYPGQGLGVGFENHRFVNRLRSEMWTEGSVDFVEGKALELIAVHERIDGLRVETGNKLFDFRAGLTIVCDGIYSRLRGAERESAVRRTGTFTGVLLPRAEVPFPDRGHVFLNGPSPVLCYPVSSERHRMLIDLPMGAENPSPTRIREYIHKHTLTALPCSVAELLADALENQRPMSMPNHLLPSPAAAPPKGVLVLGDALNMRHPLTGGGMTVALSDVAAISEMLEGADLKRKDQLDGIVESFYAERPSRNASINVLADALYGVALHPQLKDACFEYLGQGGSKASEPLSLLSAQSRDTSLLLRHFSRVALEGALQSEGKGIRERAEMLGSAFRIFSPLLFNEHGWFHTPRKVGRQLRGTERVFNSRL